MLPNVRRRSCERASVSPAASNNSAIDPFSSARPVPLRFGNTHSQARAEAGKMSDDIGAFVPGQQFRLDGKPGGPLAGLTFAAKDLFDVAGRPTGGGNPDWARANPVPTRHAWAVQTLLDAGADLIGKTVTDEVSLGIFGENPFDGTPTNPRAPGHVPGGSSSGSAAAVAGGVW